MDIPAMGGKRTARSARKMSPHDMRNCANGMNAARYMRCIIVDLNVL